MYDYPKDRGDSDNHYCYQDVEEHDPVSTPLAAS